MTAQPQNRPLPGPMLRPPMAPPPMAFDPTQDVSGRTAERTKGPSHLSRTVLIASALVAVAGVSFALGRLSVDEAPTGPSAAPFAAGAFRSDADGPAAGFGSLDDPAGLATETGADGPAAVGTETGADDVATAGIAATALDVGEASVGTGEATASAATDGSGTVAVTSLEADTPAGDGPPQRMGAPDGPPGGGAGRGGLTGTVAELTDSTLIVALADGSTQTVAVDGSTAWVEQSSITAGDVSPGDVVSVQLPFGAFGPDADDSTSVAAQVTVTAPGP